MLISQCEEEEVLVVFVELNKRQQNIKKRVAHSPSSVAYLCDMSVINNLRLAVLGAIHIYSPVYPHGKLIYKPFLLLCQQSVRVNIDNILRSMFSEH